MRCPKTDFENHVGHLIDYCYSTSQPKTTCLFSESTCRDEQEGKEEREQGFQICEIGIAYKLGFFY